MLKSICALWGVLLSCVPVLAQPDLNKFTVDAPISTTFHYGFCEVPPWILGGSKDWRSYFFVNGLNGYIGSAPGSMLSADPVILQTGPVLVTSTLGGCARPAGQPWRQNYYGVYSAQYIDDPAQGPVTIGFLHAENKTSCDGGHVTCPNSIDTMHLLNTCPAGDDWERYNSFVCAAWIPNGAATNWGQQYFPHDMGPIVWPSTGYLQPNGEKFTCGVNTPSSIVYDGYVYLFFHDDGPYGSPGLPPFYPPATEEGRCEGIKLARAPLTNALDPHAWQVFYRNPEGEETWHPSLPPGFTKETISRFWSTPGPKSTDIMGDDIANRYLDVRFSVARVRGADYFIGVESYTDPADRRVKKALRYSTDLIHWTDRLRIIETAGDWTQSNLNYPIFLSSDGWSNNLVDSTDFYVVGTSSAIRNKVNAVHVYLPAAAPRALALGPAALLAGDPNNSLSAIYPNPGHGRYQLRYTLTRPSAVQLNVLDLTGRRLLTGIPTHTPSGPNKQSLDISPLGRGLYLVELLVDGARHVYKIIDE
jgi:hypothetical protein